MHIHTNARALATVLRAMMRDATDADQQLTLHTNDTWLTLTTHDLARGLLIERHVSAVIASPGTANIALRDLTMLQHMDDGPVSVSALPECVVITQGAGRRYCVPQTASSAPRVPDLPPLGGAVGRIAPHVMRTLLTPLTAVPTNSAAARLGLADAVLLAVDGPHCAVSATDGNTVAVAQTGDTVPTVRAIVCRDALAHACDLEVDQITMHARGAWMEFDGGASGRVLARTDVGARLPDLFRLVEQAGATVAWTTDRLALRATLARVATVHAGANATPDATRLIALDLTADAMRISTGDHHTHGCETFAVAPAGLKTPPRATDSTRVLVDGVTLERALLALDGPRVHLDIPTQRSGLLRVQQHAAAHTATPADTAAPRPPAPRTSALAAEPRVNACVLLPLCAATP